MWFKKNILKMFIWLPQVLVLACRSLMCGMWALVPWPGIEPRPPALEMQSLSYWTTRDVLLAWIFMVSFFFFFLRKNYLMSLLLEDTVNTFSMLCCICLYQAPVPGSWPPWFTCQRQSSGKTAGGCWWQAHRRGLWIASIWAHSQESSES